MHFVIASVIVIEVYCANFSGSMSEMLYDGLFSFVLQCISRFFLICKHLSRKFWLGSVVVSLLVSKLTDSQCMETIFTFLPENQGLNKIR